jgi:hypothetical protein
MTRFEGPITIAVNGTPPPTLYGRSRRADRRLRAEARIDVRRAGAGRWRPASISIETLPRSRMQRVVPQAACFVVPRVSSWAEFRRARSSRDLDWTTLTTRDRVAVFIPSDVSPQEVRDCLHEEVAQALGPLNDLYRLPDSVFNDDNFHAVLTGFDMLILRTYYDAELSNGMTRAEVSARLPAVLARLNPGGARARKRHGARHLAHLDHGDGNGAWPRHGGGRAHPGGRTCRDHRAQRRLGRHAPRLQLLRAGAAHALARCRPLGAGVPDRRAIFERTAPGGMQSAHVDMQIAAFSLSAGRADEALRSPAAHCPPRRRGRERGPSRHAPDDPGQPARIPRLPRGHEAGLVTYDVEGFYYLARAAMVKDERHIDRFDQAFAHAFKGLERSPPTRCSRRRPARRLAAQARRKAPDRGGKAEIEALGGFDKLMETLKRSGWRNRRAATRAARQVDRHRRHLALRRLWLQPRRRAHRPERKPPPPRGEGLGQARVPQPRRHASNSAPATSRSR